MRIQILILGFKRLIKTLKEPKEVSLFTGCILSSLSLGKSITIFFPQGQSKLSLIMRCPQVSRFVDLKRLFISRL